MLVPFSMGKIIDIIYSTSGNDILLKNLSTFCVALVIIFIIGGLANFGRVYYIQTSGQHIVKKLREELFSSIMKQDISFFDKKKTGELINRLSADTSLVGQSLTNNLSDGMRSLVQAAAGIGMMVGITISPTILVFYNMQQLRCYAVHPHFNCLVIFSLQLSTFIAFYTIFVTLFSVAIKYAIMMTFMIIN